MCIQNWPNEPRLRTSVWSMAFVFPVLGAILLLPGGTRQTARAQATKAGPAGGPMLHSRQEGALRIGIGDMVQVSVFDTPELSAKLRVNADGTVELPVSGSTVVAGLMPREAADVIGKHLIETQMMTDPRVTVTITEYATQEISVLGEVKNPGNYLLLGPHSLYNALSAAGGTNEKAGGDIVITHVADPQKPEIIAVDSPSYSALQRLTNVGAGDVIFVSRAGSVYVLGDVVRPGEFPMAGGKRLTVLEAIALAQGTNSDAALTRASIIRKTGDGAKIIPVDLKRMTEKSEGDQTLYAEDVIVVPRSRGRAFIDAALPGLVGSIAGSAVAAMILLANK
jgi:polysaccharide export outer membrane protein